MSSYSTNVHVEKQTGLISRLKGSRVLDYTGSVLPATQAARGVTRFGRTGSDAWVSWELGSRSQDHQACWNHH